MRPSAVLCARHVGRFIQFHWHKYGKIRVAPTPTESILKSYGFDVLDVHEFLKPPIIRNSLKTNGFYDEEIPLDENHPEFKIEPCFMYKDENVLVEGLEQAKVLTNTIEYYDLPERLARSEKEIRVPEEVHKELRKRILLCCLFEATQRKLPKRVDPLRPAWNFPRNYGLTDARKNELLCSNLVTICEHFVGHGKDKSVVNDAVFCVPIEAHNKNILFEMSSELVVTRPNKLEPALDASNTFSQSLPNMAPLDCTVGLKPYHFYDMENVYPFDLSSKYPYIQTAFVHFNNTQVMNEFEEDITETQIQGRSLMKGFTLAAAQARALFGNDVMELPEPVTVPIVQTDGKMFHFTVYQLNTLELGRGSKMKNIFWNSLRIPLYELCEYQKGIPRLAGYNSKVIEKILAFLSLN